MDARLLPPCEGLRGGHGDSVRAAEIDAVVPDALVPAVAVLCSPPFYEYGVAALPLYHGIVDKGLDADAVVQRALHNYGVCAHNLLRRFAAHREHRGYECHDNHDHDIHAAAAIQLLPLKLQYGVDVVVV